MWHKSARVEEIAIKNYLNVDAVPDYKILCEYKAVLEDQVKAFQAEFLKVGKHSAHNFP